MKVLVHLTLTLTLLLTVSTLIRIVYSNYFDPVGTNLEREAKEIMRRRERCSVGTFNVGVAEELCHLGLRRLPGKAANTHNKMFLGHVERVRI